jgi:photosystem I subunit 2
MPTGGAAMMNEGENLLYLARKEQCLALGTQLRTKFKPKIEDYKIYRISQRRDPVSAPGRWCLP